MELCPYYSTLIQKGEGVRLLFREIEVKELLVLRKTLWYIVLKIVEQLDTTVLNRIDGEWPSLILNFLNDDNIKRKK